MKILIIEDDITTNEAVQLTLEVYDPLSTLTIAENGKIGLEKLRSEHFDILVLDLGLPDMDGMEVLKELRTFSQIPVLIVSARHYPAIVARALKEGAQDYILKPYDIQVFLRSLKDLTSIDSSNKNENEIIKVTNEFSISHKPLQAWYNGAVVELNDNEWKILDCLLTYWGRIVTIRALNETLGLKKAENDQFMHQAVDQLRNKMGDDLYFPRIILSEFGCGYRLVKPQR
jgi:two-component system, OmpR family, KDP operon response regulator KdpE